MPGTPSALCSSVRLVLTPVSLVWSPLFAGYGAYLSSTVSYHRFNTNLSYVQTFSCGEGADAIQGPLDKAPASTHDIKQLKVAVRSHGNFFESVPLTFLFVTLAELNGAPTYLVHVAYAALFSLRVAHAELGMKGPATAGLGRPLGAVGTTLIAVLAGVYNFTLGYDSLNNFLGLGD